MTSLTHPVLFLAHARADEDLAAEVHIATRTAGFQLWSESTDLSLDEPIPKTLTRVIGECAVFAILLTTRSVQRLWVRWELEYAFSVGKTPIIPIIGEPGLVLMPPFDRLRPEAHLPLWVGGALASRLAAYSSITSMGRNAECRSAASV